MDIVAYVIISIITISFCVLYIFMFQYEKWENKKKYFNNKDEDKTDIDDGVALDKELAIDEFVEKEEHHEKKSTHLNIPYIVLMFAMNIILANFITFLYKEPLITNIKLMFLVGSLWPIAYIDYKKKIIPNILLKVLLIGRMIIIVPEFILLGDVFHRLVSMVVATVAIIIACVICCLIVKGAIGMGDVKLFSVMALYLGLEGIWPAVFCSLIASFFIAVFSLVTRRVKRKDNIPFAPAILIGTYLSVFLTGI